MWYPLPYLLSSRSSLLQNGGTLSIGIVCHSTIESNLHGAMLKLLSIIICCQYLVSVISFSVTGGPLWRYPVQQNRVTRITQLSADNNEDSSLPAENDGGSSYESSASLIKGIVSSLTSMTNSAMQNASPDADATSLDRELEISNAPTSPQELLSRIRDDYTQNNYLWTGKLDTSAFVSDCTFTDPTLSFVGVDKFVSNMGNLVPIVEYLLGDEQLSRSELLNIALNEEGGYIETRWNMVGELNRLFWRPKIDVIGKTKFWYKEVGEESAVQVYFYDEMWEIPAGRALLQLVTKAGTIANTMEKKD